MVIKTKEAPAAAFVMELFIPDTGNSLDIFGDFECPCGDFKSNSFAHLANHHLEKHRFVTTVVPFGHFVVELVSVWNLFLHPMCKCDNFLVDMTGSQDFSLLHRLPGGDDVQHECCSRQFPVFEAFSQHVYERHRNFRNVITLNVRKVPIFRKLYSMMSQRRKTQMFELVLPDSVLSVLKVIPEKAAEYLKDVKWFDQFPHCGNFNDVLDNAAGIIQNFGRYFTFFWNCQDFAAWFLSFYGIPLKLIAPTLSDNITGSGTDSSARLTFFCCYITIKALSSVSSQKLFLHKNKMKCKTVISDLFRKQKAGCGTNNQSS